MVMIRIALPMLLLAAMTSGAQAQTDTTKIFAEARKAEIEAEEAITKFAKFEPIGPTGLMECDERVGRWCIYYDPAGKTLPNEQPKVTKAREEAIVALQKAFALAPGRAATVFPLVRLLVRHGRATEALEVARAFTAAADGPA